MSHNWKEITLEGSNDVWDKQEPIEGKLVKTEENVGPNKSRMYTIKTDDGEVKVWGSTVLDDKLLGVPEGTYIKIEYEGKLKSKKGAEYHSYKVFIDLGEGMDESGYQKAKQQAAKLKGNDADIIEAADDLFPDSEY